MGIGLKLKLKDYLHSMYSLEAQLGYNSGSILNSHMHETWLVPANPPACSGVAMLALLETI